ncbi:MAG: DNA-formamidopyrimidine glycosylase family protein [Candidatus Syntrophopropionicum ammoniitolerans]
MPELPEVETVRRTLEAKLAGLIFTGGEILLPKIVRTPDPQKFIELIKNKKILQVNRRGKYLLLTLSNSYSMAVHLRMTGALIYCTGDKPPIKYTHVLLHLDNGHRLIFADMRQFGGMWLTHFYFSQPLRLQGFRNGTVGRMLYPGFLQKRTQTPAYSD